MYLNECKPDCEYVKYVCPYECSSVCALNIYILGKRLFLGALLFIAGNDRYYSFMLHGLITKRI